MTSSWEFSPRLALRRRALSCAAAASLLLSCPAAADWSRQGLPVAVAPDLQTLWTSSPKSVMTADGEGGAYLTWWDQNSRVVRLQRLTAEGRVADGWPDTGFEIPGELAPAILRMPDGGVLLGWLGGASIRVLRFDPVGRPDPDWPEGGTVVSLAPGIHEVSLLAPDGADGAFVVWRDRSSPDASPSSVRLSHVDGAGVIDPVWGPGLNLGTGATYVFPDLVADGAGGVFVVWYTNLDTFTLRLQHVSASGLVMPGWPADGLELDSGSWSRILMDGRNHPQIVSDGGGGVYVAWAHEENSDIPPAYGSLLRLQHVLADGTPAEGWPAGGLDVTAYGARQVTMATDESGGAFVAWSDLSSYKISLQHIGASQPILRWGDTGLLLLDSPAVQVDPILLPDGQGGLFVAWDDIRSERYYDGFVTRLTAQGGTAPNWTGGGLALCESGRAKISPRLAPDDAGGMIVAWEDFRDETGKTDVYAQRIRGNGRYFAHEDPPPPWEPPNGPSILSLGPAVPNPVRGQATFSFGFPRSTFARLAIFDFTGRRVCTLLDDEFVQMGTRSLVWDGRGANGRDVPSGIYWAVLSADGERRTIRFAVAR